MIPDGAIEIFGDGLGFVKLVDWSGTELSIANAARVSFHKESKELGDGDRGLLRFLLVNKHGTPFEQGFLSHWHIRAPIFVFREWHRHRIGISINEESGRYVELRPDFYTCANPRKQIGKPGAYTFESIKDIPEQYAIKTLITNGQRDAWERYQHLLRRGVAKEVARQVLPLNIYSEMRWVCNARSLMNFLSLRNDKNAQWEIRKYAEAMEDIFAKHMPNIYSEFISNGRVAP